MVPVVDVRDMLCAQALAQIAQALDVVAPGQAITILYNAEDIKQDAIIWARERGHEAGPAAANRLTIRRAADVKHRET